MTHFTDAPRLPVIDLAPFEMGNPWRDHVAAQIDWVAAEFGLFRVINHGIEPNLGECLVRLSQRWLARGSLAKDGASFAALGDFAEELGFRDVVRDYASGVTGLGHRLMTSVARGLHLGDTYFVDRLTWDASLEFQIAPGATAHPSGPALLTLLYHDAGAHLEVRHKDRRIDVPHLPGALICAVGESLELLTARRYRVAPYRVAADSVALACHFGARVASMEHARAA
jgi:isopenicillin N synthase-like dioxygenase